MAAAVAVGDVSSDKREGRRDERALLLDIAMEPGAVLAVELADVDVRNL